MCEMCPVCASLENLQPLGTVGYARLGKRGNKLALKGEQKCKVQIIMAGKLLQHQMLFGAL